MKTWNILLFIIQLSTVTVKSARILFVVPTPFYSHQVMYRNLYKELSVRGHEVVAFTPNPLRNGSLTNLTEIDLSYFHEIMTKFSIEKILTKNKLQIINEYRNGLNLLANELFSNPEMQKLIQGGSYFDMVVVEWCVHPTLALLSKIFDCPLVGVRSVGLKLEYHDIIGNPTNPAYISIAYMDQRDGFWGRLDNFLISIFARLQHHLLVMPEAKRIVQKYFKNFTNVDIGNVERNVSLILTNTHPIFTAARPLVPSIVEVAGLHLGHEISSLSKEIKDFLDESTEGVIYFNLGTVIKSSRLCRDVTKIIIDALQELPYKVIMKWEAHISLNMSDNIKMSKWLPQEKILAHPNVKLFITHGGLLSFQEALHHHVPMIGIPFLADQFANVNRMVELGIGKRLNFNGLTKYKLHLAITDIVTNFRYKENIAAISKLVLDQPIKPMDKAIWWIEYVIRNKGAPFFQTRAVDMSWFTYLCLDVILFLVLTLVFSVFLIYSLVRLIVAVKNYNFKTLKVKQY